MNIYRESDYPGYENITGHSYVDAHWDVAIKCSCGEHLFFEVWMEDFSCHFCGTEFCVDVAIHKSRYPNPHKVKEEFIDQV